MNELEREIVEIEMDCEDFVELVRATAEAGGLSEQDMLDMGWSLPMIDLVENLRQAVRVYDFMKEHRDE